MKKIWVMIYFGLSVVIAYAQQTTHTVRAGETLYGIAHTYSLTLADLVKANPDLAGHTAIRVGQRLMIPVASHQAATPAYKATGQVHTVTKGETIYALSKRYGVSVNDLKKWNQLNDVNLQIGQQLIVSRTNTSAIYQPVVAVPSTPDTPYRDEDLRPRTENPKWNAEVEQQQILEKPKELPQAGTPISEGLKTTSANPAEYADIFNGYPSKGFKVKKNRGAAIYLTDQTSGNQFLAFYNNAETGSIIRVTNLMNHKTIFVKVMGKVPSLDSAREVMLKVSNSAAQALGVVDEKFLVEVAAYSTD